MANMAKRRGASVRATGALYGILRVQHPSPRQVLLGGMEPPRRPTSALQLSPNEHILWTGRTASRGITAVVATLGVTAGHTLPAGSPRPGW